MNGTQPQKIKTLSGQWGENPRSGAIPAGSRVSSLPARADAAVRAWAKAGREALRKALRGAVYGCLHFDGTRLAWRLRVGAAYLRLNLRRRRSMRPVVLTAAAAVLSWGILLGTVNGGEREALNGRGAATNAAFLVEASPAGRYDAGTATAGDAGGSAESAGAAAEAASSTPSGKASSSAASAPSGKTSSSAPAASSGKAASASSRPAAAKPASQTSQAAPVSQQAVSQQAASAPAVRAVPALAGDYEGDPFDDPQCVWYVWGRVKAVTGISLEFSTDSGRSANQWLSRVVENSRVRVVRDPDAVRENSIAVFSDGGEGNGHTLFVEQVLRSDSGNPRKIVFSEANWGSTKDPAQKELSWSAFRERSHGSLMGYIYVG